MIVACLAVSWFCLQGLALQNNLLTSFGFGSKFYFKISWSFINTLTLWLTSWLAVFYCVKIASFSHPIFFWLKWRTSRSVLQLLLGSLILSGLTSSSATEKSILVQVVATQSSHGNDTLAGRIQAVSLRFFLPHAIIMWSVPFLPFLVSTLSLVFLLRQYLGQMRDHRPGLSDPSTRAHTAARKSLAFFLIIFPVPDNCRCEHPNPPEAPALGLGSGKPLHSSILVHSSPKPRKALKKRLRRALGKEPFVLSYQCP
ncbi:taste receptor type 2 member 134-like [Mesoplodon densirostris]|uniref:taste receptor type 2 member 134-like n=1 Tax=Mesoplodon densirostris TaxID=48708 RepID=UPI0028DB0244|nr:taste receptor type 2 member 134-like [Mesoplodon densirostris]